MKFKAGDFVKREHNAWMAYGEMNEIFLITKPETSGPGIGGYLATNIKTLKRHWFKEQELTLYVWHEQTVPEFTGDDAHFMKLLLL